MLAFTFLGKTTVKIEPPPIINKCPDCGSLNTESRQAPSYCGEWMIVSCKEDNCPGYNWFLGKLRQL